MSVKMNGLPRFTLNHLPIDSGVSVRGSQCQSWETEGVSGYSCSAPGSDQLILPVGDQGWSFFPRLRQCTVLSDALLELNIFGLF